jgi:hypothetical protein
VRRCGSRLAFRPAARRSLRVCVADSPEAAPREFLVQAFARAVAAARIPQLAAQPAAPLTSSMNEDEILLRNTVLNVVLPSEGVDQQPPAPSRVRREASPRCCRAYSLTHSHSQTRSKRRLTWTDEDESQALEFYAPLSESFSSSSSLDLAGRRVRPILKGSRQRAAAAEEKETAQQQQQQQQHQQPPPPAEGKQAEHKGATAAGTTQLAYGFEDSDEIDVGAAKRSPGPGDVPVEHVAPVATAPSSLASSSSSSAAASAAVAAAPPSRSASLTRKPAVLHRAGSARGSLGAAASASSSSALGSRLSIDSSLEERLARLKLTSVLSSSAALGEVARRLSIDNQRDAIVEPPSFADVEVAAQRLSASIAPASPAVASPPSAAAGTAKPRPASAARPPSPTLGTRGAPSFASTFSFGVAPATLVQRPPSPALRATRAPAPPPALSPYALPVAPAARRRPLSASTRHYYRAPSPAQRTRKLAYGAGDVAAASGVAASGSDPLGGSLLHRPLKATSHV